MLRWPSQRLPAQVGFHSRFHPLVNRIRQLVVSTELGVPMAYTLRDDQYWPTGAVVPGHSSWRSDRSQAGGGALLEHSIHAADIVCWLFGPAVKVSATTRSVFGYEVEDVAAVMVEHASGVVGTILSVFNGVRGREERRFEVFFEGGALEATTDFIVGATEDSFLVQRPDAAPERPDLHLMREGALRGAGHRSARLHLLHLSRRPALGAVHCGGGGAVARIRRRPARRRARRRRLPLCHHRSRGRPMKAADDPPEPPHPAPSGIKSLASAISKWVEPEDNPAGVIYGTIAVGAVLAAESTRRETFSDTIEATVLILGLYWLAHTYATVVGDRLKARETLSLRRFWRALLHEGAIVKGAALPIAVLAALWASGVSLQTGVTAALWSSAVALVAFETIATIRSRVTGAQRLVQIVVGALLGAGVLLVRVVSALTRPATSAVHDVVRSLIARVCAGSGAGPGVAPSPPDPRLADAATATGRGRPARAGRRRVQARPDNRAMEAAYHHR